MRNIFLPLSIIASLTDVSHAKMSVIDQVQSNVQTLCTKITLNTPLGVVNTGIDFCAEIHKDGLIKYYALIKRTSEKIHTLGQNDFLDCFNNNIAKTPTIFKKGPLSTYIDSDTLAIDTEAAISACSLNK